MKKKLFIFLSAAFILIAGACFAVVTNSNSFVELEALADDTPHVGVIKCAKSENLCFGYCPKCGRMVEAFNVLGPSLAVSGWCPECIENWNKEHGNN